MPQVQKNLINFLRKNIVLAVTIIVLGTSFISVSTMEIVAPDEFKPSTGVQKILNLDDKENESEIAKLDDVESESSLVVSTSSSVVSSVSQEENSEKTSSEEIVVDQSSSVSSSSKQNTVSSKTSPYSAKSSSTVSSSAVTKSYSSKSSVQSTIQTQGSPLCRINEEYPEVAKKQRIDMKGGSHRYKQVFYLYYKDSAQIKEDKSWWFNTGGMVLCYSAETVDESLSFWFKDNHKSCSQDDKIKLQKILQIKFDSDFNCVKQGDNEPKSFDYVIYNQEINGMYKVSVDDKTDFSDINIVEYFCDSNDEFMETEWVLRTTENDYMCAADWSHSK